MKSGTKYKAVLKVLKSCPNGTIKYTAPDGEVMNIVGKNPGPDADFHVKKWEVFDEVIDKGELAMGEQYMEGNWDTSDVMAFLSFLAANQDHFDSIIFGNFLFKIYFKTSRFLKRNTKVNSKKNIQYHYDLGNNFYSLWLDKSMTYSSAVFNGADKLEQAQKNKYERILERLELPPNSHILEIGCGWGGFAEIAAKAGHSVTAVTISKEQKIYAEQRVEKAGLAEFVDVKLIDYRDLKQKYDGIVSIEMIEAVGRKFWPIYFRKLQRCLKPGGRAVIQSIIIEEKYAKSYQSSSDFIRQYIFPGGMLPSLKQFTDTAKMARLRVQDIFSFGQDYARTLDTWHHNFDAKLDEIRKMGFKDDFIKMWKFYLGICAAGFRFDRVNVMQIELGHA